VGADRTRILLNTCAGTKFRGPREFFGDFFLAAVVRLRNETPREEELLTGGIDRPEGGGLNPPITG